ncbi:unnamed protein product [Closterium sp. NIES-54]
MHPSSPCALLPHAPLFPKRPFPCAPFHAPLSMRPSPCAPPHAPLPMRPSPCAPLHAPLPMRPSPCALPYVLFQVRRPMFLITSTIYVDLAGQGIGQVHRRWHLWKRVYDAYLQ